MIPKIIHYVWLGKEKMPRNFKKCLRSWEKFCPDYKIIRWDESNLNLDNYAYVKDAINSKKYAFASDVIRLEKVYEHGGIYLDVDVELLQPIGDLLDCKCFFGFESGNLINPGIMFGSQAENKDLKNILQIYKNKHFDDKGTNETICEVVTNYYEELGLVRENKMQQIDNTIFYPSEYFSPIDIITNKIDITKNSRSIHWYNASWFNPKQKFKKFIKYVLNKLTFGWFGKYIYKKRTTK